MRLSQNAIILFQSFIRQKNGRNAKPSRGIHIAPFRGPSRARAARCWAIAPCNIPDSIMPKFSLKANSPIESKANHCIMSLTRTGWEQCLAMTCSRDAICLRIRGRYSFMASYSVRCAVGSQASKLTFRGKRLGPDTTPLYLRLVVA